MKKLFKKIAGKILREEIDALTKERDGYKQQVIELNTSNGELISEKEKLLKRISEGNKTILPNTLMAEILKRMPDPNKIAHHQTLDVDNCFKVHFGVHWSFDVKIDKLTKITDEKLELVFEVVSEDGWKQKLRIPCVVVTYQSPVTNIRTWVWNLFESGISVVPDHLYAVITASGKAWEKVIVELGL